MRKMQKLKALFSMKGRINRKWFILDSIMYSIAPKIISALLVILFSKWIRLDLFIIPMWGIFIGSTMIQLCLACRRLHDLNLSSWGALVLLIPGANLLFLIYLVGIRGTVGVNQYGADPLEGMEFINDLDSV